MSDGPRRLALTPAEVAEANLPGIGRRYELSTPDGDTVTVVVHHSGRRDLYVSGHGRHAPSVTVTLGDAQARSLGAILAGAYFKPAVVDEIEAVVGGLLIDWVTLGPASPGVGRTIADLEIRRRTGMTVAAVVRDDASIVAPEPSEVLTEGDRIVVLGRPEDLAGLVALVVG